MSLSLGAAAAALGGLEPFPSQNWEATLSSFQPLNNDVSFWWEATRHALSKLLQEAGYDPCSQYHHMRFHYLFIVPKLGPRPTTLGQPKVWKSFMTDDFSPIEYSWNWDSNPPNVRYSIEAISADSGTLKDPFNKMPTQSLMRDLCAAYPNIHTEWFNHFFNHLCDCDGNEFCLRNLKTSQSDNSSVFLAFEFQRNNDIAVKAYFKPIEAMKYGTSLWPAIYKSIKYLEYGGHLFPALDHLNEFMAKDPDGAQLEVLGLAVDCVEPSNARLKLYIRSQNASFRSIRAIMTLGNHVQSSITEENLNTLHRLWSSVLGMKGDNPEVTDHQTSGILYNFDIKPGNAIPKPKLYIPAKHFAINDKDIAEGLQVFLRDEKRDQFADNYFRVLETMSSCLGLPLARSHGIHTYIACGFKSGMPSITSYMNPEIYKQR